MLKKANGRFGERKIRKIIEKVKIEIIERVEERTGEIKKIE